MADVRLRARGELTRVLDAFVASQAVAKQHAQLQVAVLPTTTLRRRPYPETSTPSAAAVASMLTPLLFRSNSSGV